MAWHVSKHVDVVQEHFCLPLLEVYIHTLICLHHYKPVFRSNKPPSLNVMQVLSLSLSFSHSLSIHSYALYTYNYKSVQQHKLFFPKSYLYTYDFQAIYTYGLKRLTRTHSRLCPFQPVGRITTGSSTVWPTTSCCGHL